jgi:hypothetical protein
VSGIKFEQKSFTFAPAATSEYRSEWERIFGAKDALVETAIASVKAASTDETLYLDPTQIEGCKKIDARIAELTLPICDHCRKSVPEVLTHGGLLLCKQCLGDQ